MFLRLFLKNKKHSVRCAVQGATTLIGQPAGIANSPRTFRTPDKFLHLYYHICPDRGVVAGWMWSWSRQICPRESELVPRLSEGTLLKKERKNKIGQRKNLKGGLFDKTRYYNENISLLFPGPISGSINLPFLGFQLVSGTYGGSVRQCRLREQVTHGLEPIHKKHTFLNRPTVYHPRGLYANAVLFSISIYSD